MLAVFPLLSSSEIRNCNPQGKPQQGRIKFVMVIPQLVDIKYIYLSHKSRGWIALQATLKTDHNRRQGFIELSLYSSLLQGRSVRDIQGMANIAQT